VVDEKRLCRARAWARWLRTRPRAVCLRPVQRAPNCARAYESCCGCRRSPASTGTEQGLLAREDPHPALFDHYAQALALLAAGAPQAGVLRAFELLLLGELGWLPALDHDSASLQPLQPERRYQLQAQGGLHEVAAPDGGQHEGLDGVLAQEQMQERVQGRVQEEGRASLNAPAAAAGADFATASCSADYWLALHAALQTGLGLAQLAPPVPARPQRGLAAPAACRLALP